MNWTIALQALLLGTGLSVMTIIFVDELRFRRRRLEALQYFQNIWEEEVDSDAVIEAGRIVRGE